MPATWKRVYKGPFDFDEADRLARSLRAAANPTVNLIHDARIHRRKGERRKYDVQALIEKIT